MEPVIEEKCIGDCGVCYIPLMPRSNHAFTECGHMFCIKCLLTWHEQSSTCPMCREKLYVKDDADVKEDDAEDSWDGYTDDSGDDGRFDTIDDYLPEEIEWSGIIEEDDLKISISEDNLSQIRDMRKRILDLFIFQTYTTDLLSPLLFNGEISTILINRIEYKNMLNVYLNGYYELVLKTRDSVDDETHYFGIIIEKKIVNVPQGFYPDGGYMRYTLEYAFEMDVYDPLDEAGLVYQRTLILFRDICRVYSFQPIYD